jgi:hypothetical protein
LVRWVSARHWGAGTALLVAFAAIVLAVGWLVSLKGLAWGSEADGIGSFLLTLAALILSLLALAFPPIGPALMGRNMLLARSERAIRPAALR